MNTLAHERPVSVSPAIWIGRILSGLAIAFLLLDSAMKLVDAPQVAETMTQLGYPTDLSRGLGITILVCTILYAVPSTAVLGAILITGILGGAIATHLRVGSPIFSHLLFGVYVGAVVWGGLYLRNPQLRALLPFANAQERA